MRPGPRPGPVGASGPPNLKSTFWDSPAGLLLYNGAQQAAKVALVAVGLSLVFLGWGVFGGHLVTAQLADSPGTAQFRLWSMVFCYGCLLLAASVVLRYHQEDGYMVSLLGLGAFATFGVPFLLNSMLGALDADLSSHAGADAVNDAGRAAGIAIFILVGARFLAYGAVRLTAAAAHKAEPAPEGFEILVERSGGQAARPVPGSSRTFAACWELPFCSEYVRATCPRFAERKSCWKRKSGCHCDVDLLGAALGLDAVEKGLRSANRITRQALQDASGRKISCSECRIFIEHQRRKFRLFSAFALPVTIMLLLALRPLIGQLWGTAVQGLARVTQVVAFSSPGTERATQLVTDLQSEAMVWAIVVISGLFLLSGVARLIEWLVLQVKVI